MSTVELKNLSLIETLKSEARVCPQCRFEERNPFVDRCPRCFKELPRIQAECPGCIHRVVCPVVKQ